MKKFYYETLKLMTKFQKIIGQIEAFKIEST